jgi:hypothetical protein
VLFAGLNPGKTFLKWKGASPCNELAPPKLHLLPQPTRYGQLSAAVRHNDSATELSEFPEAVAGRMFDSTLIPLGFWIEPDRSNHPGKGDQSGRKTSRNLNGAKPV